MFSAASAVNFNYDAQLKGSLTKQPTWLAVQGHVYGADGGCTVHWETWKSDKGNKTLQSSPCLTAPLIRSICSKGPLCIKLLLVFVFHQ